MARKATKKQKPEFVGRYTRFDAWWVVALTVGEDDEVMPETGDIVAVRKVDGEVRKAKLGEVKGVSVGGEQVVYFAYTNAK